MMNARQRLALLRRIDRLIAPILFLLALLVNKFFALNLTFEQVGSVVGLYALNSLALQNVRLRGDDDVRH